MKKIIINVAAWQTRVAILRDGQLQNIYFSSPVSTTLEQSYFKGVVTTILPGIQTAFVDIGQEKAGFLHISEIDRELAIDRMSSTVDLDDAPQQRESHHRQAMDIGKILKEGEHILVQVSKEPVYEKGAKLTTCFTLPGRFIVLMPNIPRIAISKKIEEREERIRLKEILMKNLPEGMGAIIRTTSQNRTEKEIVQDVQYLTDIWQTIMHEYQKAKPQQKIHEDLPLPLRMIRDHLDDDVEEVIVDDKQTQADVYKFVKKIAPEYMYKVKLYSGPQNIFEKYQIDKQIEQALSHKVPLRSGGSLIIETTEAMTVVDVNTGKYIGKANLEDTILKTNLEAAEEVVRQLRLRNIGGLIVIDFIDMASSGNQQKLMRFLEKTLKERDKFQSVVLKVSEFGLVQMTRKRSGKTLLQELTRACSCCHGLGFVKSTQMQCYAILSEIREKLQKMRGTKHIEITFNPTIFDYITTIEYNAILAFEKELGLKITLMSNPEMPVGEFHIK
ncbi:Rne/Rng family ribonuclease [Candidatus Dependentiae bacterium]|nr:Rne/Rng family ribonuclease [Candidatus Dependentiae bacterium]